jgi:hypothetical protein
MGALTVIRRRHASGASSAGKSDERLSWPSHRGKPLNLNGNLPSEMRPDALHRLWLNPPKPIRHPWSGPAGPVTRTATWLSTHDRLASPSVSESNDRFTDRRSRSLELGRSSLSLSGRFRHDPQVLLFYKAESPDRWICAVVKRNGEGFLVTADPTDAIKEGVRI